MSKKLGIVALALVAVVLLAPQGASAGCTASFTCSNACSAHTECPSGLFLSCSAPNEVVTCSGNTTCTVGTNSVTCDGTVKTCQTKASRCRTASDSVLCGTTFKACPTCGGRGLPDISRIGGALRTCGAGGGGRGVRGGCRLLTSVSGGAGFQPAQGKGRLGCRRSRQIPELRLGKRLSSDSGLGGNRFGRRRPGRPVGAPG